METRGRAWLSPRGQPLGCEHARRASSATQPAPYTLLQRDEGHVFAEEEVAGAVVQHTADWQTSAIEVCAGALYCYGADPNKSYYVPMQYTLVRCTGKVPTFEWCPVLEAGPPRRRRDLAKLELNDPDIRRAVWHEYDLLRAEAVRPFNRMPNSNDGEMGIAWRTRYAQASW